MLKAGSTPATVWADTGSPSAPPHSPCEETSLGSAPALWAWLGRPMRLPVSSLFPAGLKGGYEWKCHIRRGPLYKEQ